MKKRRGAGFLRKELLDICRKQYWLNGSMRLWEGLIVFNASFME